MDTIELIEDYLKGRLQGQELELFEKRMDSDPSFAREVEVQRMLVNMTFTQGLIETREKLQAIRKTRQGKEGGKGGWNGIGLVVISFLVMTSIYVLVIKDKTSSIHPAQKPTVSGTTTEEKTPQIPKESHSGSPQDKIFKEQEKRNEKTGSVPDSSLVVNGLPIVVAKPDTQAVYAVKQKSESENTKPVKAPTDFCSGVSIKAKILKEASCADKATGKILLTNITGGKGPYSFLLNDSPSGDHPSFSDLQPGNYQIRISDANGCSAQFAAEVERKNCSPEKATIFAPDYGETWKFPLSASGNCKVRIFDMAGTLVYEVNTLNGHPSEWNGVGNNETYIKAGAYIYQINCDDGQVNQGSVTVTR